jgi:hypothetical protein
MGGGRRSQWEQYLRRVEVHCQHASSFGQIKPRRGLCLCYLLTNILFLCMYVVQWCRLTRPHANHELCHHTDDVTMVQANQVREQLQPMILIGKAMHDLLDEGWEEEGGGAATSPRGSRRGSLVDTLYASRSNAEQSMHRGSATRGGDSIAAASGTGKRRLSTSGSIAGTIAEEQPVHRSISGGTVRIFRQKSTLEDALCFQRAGV